MTDEKQKEILGILLIAFGLFVFLSIISYDGSEIPEQFGIGYVKNYMGIAGLYIADTLVRGLFGYFSVIIPILVIMWGIHQLASYLCKDVRHWTWYGSILMLFMSVLAGLVTYFTMEDAVIVAGGIGITVAGFMFDTFHTAGTILIFVLTSLILFMTLTKMSLKKGLEATGKYFRAIFNRLNRRRTNWLAQHGSRRFESPAPPTNGMPPVIPAGIMFPDDRPVTPRSPFAPEPANPERNAPAPDLTPPFPTPSPETAEVSTEPRRTTPRVGQNYELPNLDLLDVGPEQEYELTWDDLDNQSRILEDTLNDFGIEGKVVKINPGPVITRFEVEPAPGIKVSKFTSLADDLARVMRAQRIRVVAPIPGKASIGIEIPNPQPQIVYFSEIVTSPQFQDSKSPLALVLGKTIDGMVYTTDLRAMPHLLIAGATGSGKSVCINTIITGILFKAHPKAVQLVLIDPKRLELAPYRNLRQHHLLFRPDLSEEVITSSANAISILKSLVLEMERRYDLLAEAGVRKIEDFNVKLQAGTFQPGQEIGLHGILPYLVVVIDELADLMLTAAKEVEEPIARLTQMSRAVGIHLIVATQRPSVDVITGVIKANFPCRIGFYVASKTDSRTILDMNGAEKLLGRGDMLFLPPGSPEPVRIHGAYLSTEEVERVVAHIQAQPHYPKSELPVEAEEEAALAGLDGEFDRDKFFNEAAKIVVHTGQGSVSILQRRLKVGYARAARLIDQLEKAGVVGAFDGSKAREVLMTEDDLIQLGIY
ncbi:DNA translocase FtsK 4TM domain-containing protein [candidate division KSB1 bacterium]|nr:DNA translocase FtsK 4TM domain-containing protein [candidate division KSB1 bacterium]